ncbi:MAG: enoyl-CoA hydratase/isomerase family protein [Actinobacteria bacterium]|nr:enoyl-CoA hydratase/isomerase family protein [Actinomycetota bacterium]
MTSPVEYEKRGKVGVITLNRPEARNAINGDVAAAFEAAIDKLEGDDEAWVGVLRANTSGQERPVFCAGADLKAINTIRQREASGEGPARGSRRRQQGSVACRPSSIDRSVPSRRREQPSDHL